MSKQSATQDIDEDPLAGVIEQLSPSVRELFVAIRAMINEINPDVVEVGWPRQKTAGFGVGPKKMSEQYNYIVAYSHHVNLGFYYGAELPDPYGLLAGDSKSMRSVRIAELDDLEQRGLRKLLETAPHYLPRLKT